MRKFLELGDDIKEVSFQFKRFIGLLCIYILAFQHECQDNQLSCEDAEKLGYQFNHLVPLLDVMEEKATEIRDMLRGILDKYEVEGEQIKKEGEKK